MSTVTAGTIAILSIDGGGVRGIIPGVILQYLESELQKHDGKNARLADYFDVISGTSTGALIATMISTPNDEGRPLYEANKIVPFYKQECPKIFSNSDTSYSRSYPNNTAVEVHLNHSENSQEMHLKVSNASQENHNNIGGSFFCPTYNGKYLHKLARKILKEKRLSDTLTNVVIPAYDTKKLSPVIFSSYEVAQGNSVLNAKLSDICISTTAAPTYFPAYKFHNEGVEFNMIDGGVAANNPTLTAITEALKPARAEVEQNYSPLLILSLGTGVETKSQMYTADKINSWHTMISWIYQKKSWNPFNWEGYRPLLEILFDASVDMVDHYCTMFYKSRNKNPENFLRVQESNLPEELAPMDAVETKLMNELEQIGWDLLKKPVTRLNIPTFERISEEGNETYKQALDRFAESLVHVKNMRRAAPADDGEAGDGEDSEDGDGEDSGVEKDEDSEDDATAAPPVVEAPVETFEIEFPESLVHVKNMRRAAAAPPVAQAHGGEAGATAAPPVASFRGRAIGGRRFTNFK